VKNQVSSPVADHFTFLIHLYVRYCSPVHGALNLCLQLLNQTDVRTIIGVKICWQVFISKPKHSATNFTVSGVWRNC